MKIAFLNIYNGVIERGSEVFVIELAEKLGKKHKIWVFQTGQRSEDVYKTVQIKGIPFASKHGLFYDLLVLLFTLKCIPYLWKEKYDWIIPINGRWQVIICRMIRWLRGGKILISGHAGVGFEDRFNIMFGKPDVFVALSPLAQKWAIRHSEEQRDEESRRNQTKRSGSFAPLRMTEKRKVIYIPNGINVEQFNPSVKPAKVPLKPAIILCVSALLPYKRIDRLIHAVRKLQKASLLVIGDGPLKEEVEQFGKQELGDRFLLLPYVSHDQLPFYYKAAHVFSLPSRESEAFGLVYLEALACNIPVVAPDDKNRRHIIGDEGLYCNVENVDEYTDALNRALTENFGNKPRKQAEKFSWERIAKEYEEIMHDT